MKRSWESIYIIFGQEKQEYRLISHFCLKKDPKYMKMDYFSSKGRPVENGRNHFIFLAKLGNLNKHQNLNSIFSKTGRDNYLIPKAGG